MKKIFILCGIFITAYASFLQAQVPESALKTILTRKLLTAPTVSQLSQRANVALQQQMANIATFALPEVTRTPNWGHPAATTFQVQISPVSFKTASAFAISLNGKVYGVTAAHVMENIRQDPYMKVKTPQETFEVAPITHWISGHPKGMDVALFEIPEQMHPLLTILKPAEQLQEAGSSVKIPGFTSGNALFVPDEKILFTSPLRMLIQRRLFTNFTGFCGSPVLNEDNKVAAIYAGFESPDSLRHFAWFNRLPENVQKMLPSLHFAIPVQSLQILAQADLYGSSQKAGQMMKVLNHPVAPLHPNEYIYSIQQFRDGKIKETIYTSPFLNPEKLEQFFELEENDVLRITIARPQTAQTRSRHVSYEINVSTHEVKIFNVGGPISSGF